MNDGNKDAGKKLQKLGERLRLGLRFHRPSSRKISDAVIQTILKQKGGKPLSRPAPETHKMAEQLKKMEW